MKLQECPAPILKPVVLQIQFRNSVFSGQFSKYTDFNQYLLLLDIIPKGCLHVGVTLGIFSVYQNVNFHENIFHNMKNNVV